AGQLGEAGLVAEALRELPVGDPTALELWNDLHILLANAAAACSLLSQVHPDSALREAAEEGIQELSRFSTDLMLDAAVFERLSAVPGDDLDDGAARVLADALRAYRRAGVDRDEETRERLRALAERATALDQAFSRNIRDGAGETRVAPEALAGLPADYVEAHPVGDDGLVTITTGYPDTNPFMLFSTDAAARRAVISTFLDLGWPANDAVLAELLAVRDEQARLLGYDGWADYDADVKMIGSGAAIAEFIDQITRDATPASDRDVAVLVERARRDRPDLVTLDVADSRYYGEVVRREQYDVDAQVVRAYFDFTRVRRGLLDVTGRLFGLTYTDVPDAPVWHPEVTVHDVYLGEELLGRIYLDLHPRADKYNHAAQFTLVDGIGGRQLPEGVLVCNFGRAVMEHSEVVTLFHEFGHLMHHVLAGRHPWARFSGVATEWDFVEAPSQMLEEWAWDADVLATFATDAGGTAIPAELVAKMRAADEFGKGYYARTQMFYAAVSYRLHQELPADLTARVRELSEQYAAWQPIPGSHFHCGFGHLGGYSSAYYTYMWSAVIAKDLFSAFDHDDLFDTAVATRYRDLVLAAGGSKDAADLVADFLGRPYSSDAFRAWLES
ncbi:MAG: peptidase M3, partial [Actinobacteria bacterium]|nr:peptidase M3 [Actinomycetota bacterium]